MLKTNQNGHTQVEKKKGVIKMKKHVLYLIIVSAILMLAGWTSIGPAMDTQKPQAVVSAAFPRSEAPDYFADGQFFNEMYLQSAPSVARQAAPDYRLDAEFFNTWYRDVSASRQSVGVPDYPLDGKLFNDVYS
jgi:hypothetical protein